MAVANTFKLASVLMGTDVIGGIEDDELTLDPDVRQEAQAGDIYSHKASLSAENPGGRFTTYQLNRFWAIQALANRLKPISIASLTPNFLALYGHKFNEAVPATGAAHIKYLVREGAIWWDNVRIAHQDDARLSVMFAATWDETNDPIAKSQANSLPTDPDEQCFTLGPVQIGNATTNFRLRAFREMNIRSGIRVDREGAEGDIFPTFATVGSILPAVEINGINPDWVDDVGAVLDTIPLTGLECEHSNTIIYLRRRLHGGGFWDDAEAVHIKLTCSGIVVPDTVARRRVTQSGETGFVIHCAVDEVDTPAAAPIQITTETAISTVGWPA